jgi:hypothetical protein
LVKVVTTVFLGLMDKSFLSHHCCISSRAVCSTSETSEGNFPLIGIAVSYAGAGMRGYGMKLKFSCSLGQYTTVFQAEVYAINACAVENIKRGYLKRNIYWYSGYRLYAQHPYH